MEAKYKYVVATRCFTFNHAPYIENALRGFVMQETTFPAVYIIVDDASTDGEPGVIKKWASDYLKQPEGKELWAEMPYGELAVASLAGKTHSLFVILLLAENHYQKKQSLKKFDYISEWLDNAKYHALCEGDDYWIVSQKLQMQVDFLENHPDYVLCHTDFNLSNGKRRNHTVIQTEDDCYFPHIVFNGMQIGTATTMFLSDAFKRTPKLNHGKNWSMGDLPMWIEMSREGKIKFLPIVTTCYRELNDSASHGSLEKELAFVKTSIEIRSFYAHYYRLELPNDGYGKSYYTAIMKCAYKHKSKQTAAKCMKEATSKNMVSPKLILFWMATYSRLFGLILKMIWR